ncbi:MAG: hypothetical protein PCFJNLEI_01648 [Verrucomicrobiae bacterium]|nr:hypothetical protein [Verrucomicrobiae bacterium]
MFRFVRLGLMFLLLTGVATAALAERGRVLVLSPRYGASQFWPDFEYWTRQLDLEMTYWHSYPREWDVYHLMDSLQKKDWRDQATPLNARAFERLRERLEQDWDLIVWNMDDLPDWAREKLAERVAAGKPLIYFGDSSKLAAGDALTDWFAAAAPVSNAPALFPRPEQWRVTPAPQHLWIFPHSGPYPESARPATDEVAALTQFWREQIAKLLDRPVPAAPAAPTASPDWPVGLTVTPDCVGAEFGESITLTVAAETAPAGTLVLAVADRLGRVLWQQSRPVTAGTIAETFAYKLPDDLGVDIYAYYVTAWLLVNDQPVGRGTTTLYHYRPWDMRRQWQWSPWESLYRDASYRAAASMNLFADAGMNSLGTGYATSRSLWWAERYGWRKYAELQGGKKLWNAPVVETDNDDELRRRVRQQMHGMHKNFGGAWPGAALTLGSLGEEPGFGNGWGTTYYWDTAAAPPVAQRVFQQFLRERYATVAALAASWQTPLTNWADALLLKKYSLDGPKFDPTESVEDAPEDARDQARYVDSTQFFTWYFRKVAQLGTATAREINPAIRTFYSLHGPKFAGAVGVAHMHHLYYPKEYQATEAAQERMRTGGEPCFSLIWNHFDEPATVSAGLWSQVANQVTHVNFWLGFPLMLNYDLTHTRASMVLKRFLRRFQPVSDLLARATIPESGAALLVTPSLERRWAHRNLQSAFTMLAESGFPPSFADETQLASQRLVFATAATQIGTNQAAPLRAYVERGGVLITTSGFASLTERGRIFETAPGDGWDQWMGFRYSAALERESLRGRDKIMIKDGGPFTWGPIQMASTPFAVTLTDLAPDIEVVARLADGTPAVLHRAIGKGHLYHFNFLHREWGWGMAVRPDREPSRRLVSEIARRHDIRPRYFIENRAATAPAGDGLPYWGSQLFVGADGRTQYLVVFNDHRSPLITGRIHWYERGWRLRDLLAGTDLPWTGQSERGDYLDLPLQPGDGRVLQLVPAGHTPETPPPAPQTPPNLPLPHNLQPVVPRGWPSEKWPARTLTDPQLVATLDQLRDVYERGTNRLALSYYLFDANTENRHALTRSLAEQRWPDRVNALESALRAGSRWLLTGEDLGLDPATGLTVTTQQPAVLAALTQLGQRRGGQWFAGTADGQTLVLTLGKGRLVLDRTSLDSVGFYDREYTAWQQLWWPVLTRLLEAPPANPISALDETRLTTWLAGRWLPLAQPVVTQFADRRDRVTLNWPARPPLTPPLATLTLPRDCRVVTATLTVTVKPAGDLPANIRLGVGGGVVPELSVAAAGEPVSITDGLAELINAWLPRAPVNDNGLVVVPLHIRTDGEVAVTLSEPRIELQHLTK